MGGRWSDPYIVGEEGAVVHSEQPLVPPAQRAQAILNAEGALQVVLKADSPMVMGAVGRRVDQQLIVTFVERAVEGRQGPFHCTEVLAVLEVVPHPLSSPRSLAACAPPSRIVSRAHI